MSYVVPSLQNSFQRFWLQLEHNIFDSLIRAGSGTLIALFGLFTTKGKQQEALANIIIDPLQPSQVTYFSLLAKRAVFMLQFQILLAVVAVVLILLFIRITRPAILPVETPQLRRTSSCLFLLGLFGGLCLFVAAPIPNASPLRDYSYIILDFPQVGPWFGVFIAMLAMIYLIAFGFFFLMLISPVLRVAIAPTPMLRAVYRSIAYLSF
jgi:hypothetical protein